MRITSQKPFYISSAEVKYELFYK